MLLGLAASTYALVPAGGWGDAWYDVVGAASVVLAWSGVRRRRPDGARSWFLVVAGFGGWVLGDVASSVEQQVLHLTGAPFPSDAVYLASYLVLGAGLLTMARSRQPRESLGVFLDAAMMATGAGVVVGVFVVAPIVADPTWARWPRWSEPATPSPTSCWPASSSACGAPAGFARPPSGCSTARCWSPCWATSSGTCRSPRPVSASPRAGTRHRGWRATCSWRRRAGPRHGPGQKTPLSPGSARGPTPCGWRDWRPGCSSRRLRWCSTTGNPSDGSRSPLVPR